MSTCNKCKSPCMIVCSRCRCTHYCSNECQINDWVSHKSTCNANASAGRRIESAEAKKYLNGALRNNQFIGFICARMAHAEFFGMNRGFASVFVTQTAPGLYSGTFTIIKHAPEKSIMGKNCIEFKYLYAGKYYTEFKFISWKTCQTHHDSFKLNNIDLMTNHSRVTFNCDSYQHMEIGV